MGSGFTFEGWSGTPTVSSVSAGTLVSLSIEPSDASPRLVSSPLLVRKTTTMIPTIATTPPIGSHGVRAERRRFGALRERSPGRRAGCGRVAVHGAAGSCPPCPAAARRCWRSFARCFAAVDLRLRFDITPTISGPARSPPGRSDRARTAMPAR